MRCFNCLADDYSNKCNVCGSVNANINKNTTALSPGSTLDDRYFIGRVLGQGGFGITYIAFDEILGGVVAIKEHYPKAIVDRTKDGSVIASNTKEFNLGLKKFTEEAKAVAKFKNHPNIVSVLSYMRSNNTAYMVMEYIQGKTVKDILVGGKKLPVKDALQVIHQVLDGIGVCHNSRLIHRDLTPDNIYITTQGGVKILDFGSARETVDGGDNEFTQVLKKSYAPVEQFQQGQSQGPWTDIYSIGASLYRMLIGKPPELNSVDRLLNDTLKSPLKSANLKDWNQSLDDALMKAMAVRPELRYQHVDEFRVDLLNGLDSLETFNKVSPKSSSESKTAKPKVNTAKQSERKNKSYIPLVGSIAAAVLIGILAILNTGSGDSNQAVVINAPSVNNSTSNQEKNEIAKIESKTIAPPAGRPTPPDIPNFNEAIIKPNVKAQPTLATLTVSPSNAKIFINNKLLADNQLNLDKVSGKSINLKIIAPGYRTLESNEIISQNKTFYLQKYQLPSVNLYSLLLNYFEAPSGTNSSLLKQEIKKDYSSFEGISKLPDILNGDLKLSRELDFLSDNGDYEAEFLLLILNLSDNKAQNDESSIIGLENLGKNYPLANIMLASYKGCLIISNSSCNTKQALKHLPKNTPELSNLLEAMFLVKEKRFIEAETKLQVVRESSSVVSNLKGEILFGKGKTQEAKAYFRKAYSQDVLTNTSAHINLAFTVDSEKERNKLINEAVSQGSLRAKKILPYISFNEDKNSFAALVQPLMSVNQSEANMLLALYEYNKDPKNLNAVRKHTKLCKQNVNCKILDSLINTQSSNISTTDLRDVNLLPELKAQAHLKLGKVLLSKNSSQSIPHFIEAKKLGSQDSIAVLCYAYAFIERNDAKALSECESGYAAGIKDPLLLNTLSHMYSSSDIFKSIKRDDYSKMKSLLTESCNLGSGGACCNLSKYEKNSSLKKKYSAKAKESGVRQCST